MTDTLQPLRRQLAVASEPPVKADGVIKWAPVHFARRLSFAGSSYLKVREALTKVFGKFPIELQFKPDEPGQYLDDANLLKAMAAAAGDGGEPFEDLRTALMKYHGILITEK